MTQLGSLASQTIGQTLEVTLYLCQLCYHIYTNDDFAEIDRSLHKSANKGFIYITKP